MENEYFWTCKNLEVLTSHNGLTDVVVRVHWSYTAKSKDNPLITVSTNGATDLDTSSISSEGFIPLSELTSAKVEEWVTSKISEAYALQLKTYLDKMIKERITPSRRNVVLNK
jgi:hypothetical protein